MRLSKAVLFVLCALLAAFSAFAQEETFATCQMPEGSEFLYITEATGFQVPQGLEEMYALMLDSNGQSDVYIARMRYGRALASISCTTARDRALRRSCWRCGRRPPDALRRM